MIILILGHTSGIYTSHNSPFMLKTPRPSLLSYFRCDKKKAVAAYTVCIPRAVIEGSRMQRDATERQSVFTSNPHQRLRWWGSEEDGWGSCQCHMVLIKMHSHSHFLMRSRGRRQGGVTVSLRLCQHASTRLQRLLMCFICTKVESGVFHSGLTKLTKRTKPPMGRSAPKFFTVAVALSSRHIYSYRKQKSSNACQEFMFSSFIKEVHKTVWHWTFYQTASDNSRCFSWELFLAADRYKLCIFSSRTVYVGFTQKKLHCPCSLLWRQGNGSWSFLEFLENNGFYKTDAVCKHSDREIFGFSIHPSIHPCCRSV